MDLSNLTQAQLDYFNRIQGDTAQARSPEEALQYVSGLNDAQAQLSRQLYDATQNHMANIGMSNTNPTSNFAAAPGEGVEYWKNQAGIDPYLGSRIDQQTYNTFKNSAPGTGTYIAPGTMVTGLGIVGQTPGLDPVQGTAQAPAIQSRAPSQQAVAQPQAQPLGQPAQQNPYSMGNPWEYATQNPYLSSMADTIRNQVNDNLQRNILPSISSQAQMAGGYGGSRQGVVEANAVRDANQTLSNSLSNMYYGDYNNQLNRQLQKYGADQGYNLGMGNLGLGMVNSANNYSLGLGSLSNQAFANQTARDLGYGQLALGQNTANQNYQLGLGGLANTSYANQTARDLGQQQIGLGYYGADTNRMLGMGQLGLGYTQAANNYDLGLRGNDLGFATLDYNINNANNDNTYRWANFGMNALNNGVNMANTGVSAGTNIHNTPMNYWQNFGNYYNGTGNGYGTTSGNYSSNPLLGAFGGMQMGGALYNAYRNNYTPSYYNSGTPTGWVSGSDLP